LIIERSGRQTRCIHNHGKVATLFLPWPSIVFVRAGIKFHIATFDQRASRKMYSLIAIALCVFQSAAAQSSSSAAPPSVVSLWVSIYRRHRDMASQG
jgi:hypothetical protein